MQRGGCVLRALCGVAPSHPLSWLAYEAEGLSLVLEAPGPMTFASSLALSRIWNQAKRVMGSRVRVMVGRKSGGPPS